MAAIVGLLFFTFLSVILATPTPESEDLSQFFHNADPGTRIVGGTIATEGSHPHMVALTDGWLVRSYVCGGSVIATRTVLTAAHCIDVVYSGSSLSRHLRVIVGTNRWSQGGDSYTVTSNVTHYRYSASTVKNDIGLLYTAAAIVYSELVRPVPISFGYVGAGVQTIAAGWGIIVTGGPVSEQLLELTVPTISGEQCLQDVTVTNANLRPPPHDPKIELCTLHSMGHGMCRGDSGSALLHVYSGTQIGLVSWGFPCAHAAPDIFVRLSAYEAWIVFYTRF